MRRTKASGSKTYNLENCFGFNDSDVDLNLWNDSSVMNNTNVPLEFQPNKPYRLALYVRPSQQRRLHRTNSHVLAKSACEKHLRNNKNESNISVRTTEKKEIKRTNKRESKAKNVMLFDENVKPENVAKKLKTPEKSKAELSVITEVPSTRKNILREINTKPLTKTRQNKIRRSYERKCKEKEVENIPEPPSEEIIKEIEMKKISRTKPKKVVKEEQEFENWANNMNSAFDDVDKFELSITYD